MVIDKKYIIKDCETGRYFTSDLFEYAWDMEICKAKTYESIQKIYLDIEQYYEEDNYNPFKNALLKRLEIIQIISINNE